jgi:hypothetical protein
MKVAILAGTPGWCLAEGTELKTKTMGNDRQRILGIGSGT